MCPLYTDEDLTGFAAGDLSRLRAGRFRRHLGGCADCRAAWEATRSLWSQAGALRTLPVPGGLPDRVYATVAATQPAHDGPLRSSWRPAAIFAGGCAAVAAVALLLPGQPARPTVTYADVERAMQTVNILHCVQDFSEYNRHGNLVQQSSTQIWLRLAAPANLLRIHDSHFSRDAQRHISIMLTDQRGMIRYDPTNATYYIDDVHREPNMGETSAHVQSLIRQMTDPGNTSWPHPMASATVVSTTHGLDRLDGKTVLKFVYVTPLFRKTVWADSKTFRLVQMKTEFATTGKDTLLLHRFQYDVQPPPGTFDWSPPPGAHIKVL